MSVAEAPVGADSTLEGELRSRLGDLQPTESLELSGSAGFALEAAADFRGKLRVERNREGFTVEVEGQAEGGVGAGSASARVGIAAGTKFRVATAAEAADLCDALLKGAVVNASNAVLPGASFAAEAAHLVGVEGHRLLPAVRGHLLCGARDARPGRARWRPLDPEAARRSPAARAHHLRGHARAVIPPLGEALSSRSCLVPVYLPRALRRTRPSSHAVRTW